MNEQPNLWTQIVATLTSWLGVLGTLGGALALPTCNGGCAIMDTGPKLATEVAANGKALMYQIITQTSPTAGTASISGGVDNPEYYMRGETGPVYKFELVMGLRNANLDFNVAAELGPKVANDAEFNSQLLMILTNPQLSEAEKNARIHELVKLTLDRVLPASGEATTQPSE